MHDLSFDWVCKTYSAHHGRWSICQAIGALSEAANLAVDFVGQALQGLIGGTILLKGCLHIAIVEVIV